MAPAWQKIVRFFQIMRLDVICSAVSNLWLMIFLTALEENGRRAQPALANESLGRTLGLGAAVAIGLSVYALALNDALDARHDQTFSPQRPVAAGAIRQTTAFGLAVLGLLAAALASTFLGVLSSVLCLITAAAILFYNIAGKFFPAFGVMLIGLIRGLSMFIPYPWLMFAWPIWLTGTHVMASAAVVHVLAGKRPRLHGTQWWGLCSGWVFWTLVMAGWMGRQTSGGPGLIQGHPLLWIGPLVAVAVFVAISWRSLRAKMRPLRSRRVAAGAFSRWSMLWLIIYDAIWLLGAGLYRPGCLLLALFVVAWTASKIIAALDHILSPPVTYQVKPAPSV